MTVKEEILSLFKKVLKPNNRKNEVVCVQISKRGLSIVLAKIKPVLQILDCQYFSGDFAKQQGNLSSFIERNQLRHSDCYGVLALEDYRLMLVEKPNVVDNEIGESLRWLVKDLIDFPLEEAVVDFFPAPTRIGQPAKIYTVIAHLQWLNTIANMIVEAGLNLKSVNIAALAMRNIFSSLHVVGNSAVFLVKEGEHYYVLVIKNQLIYLERKLEFNSQNFYNELVAELQRSIDFYQNRDKTIPVKIFLDPVLGQNKELVQFIETALNLSIEGLDTNKWLNSMSSMSPSDKNDCLSVVGEALGLEQA